MGPECVLWSFSVLPSGAKLDIMLLKSARNGKMILIFRLHLFWSIHWYKLWILLVFSITPFKIDQNKNQNRSIDKVQNLGNERRYIYKDPRQDSGQRNISYTRYPKKYFTQTYRDLYGDAMLVLTWMSSNMADGNQQKHLLPSFATKAWIYSSRNS